MGRRVLVVEDELAAQILVRQLLHRIDPTVDVQCTSTAEAAYRLLNDSVTAPAGYDLVIIDVGLPGSNGLVLWELASKSYPSLEYLFVSGVTYEEWSAKTAGLHASPPLMRKPVREAQLRRFWEEKFLSTGQLAS